MPSVVASCESTRKGCRTNKPVTHRLVILKTSYECLTIVLSVRVPYLVRGRIVFRCLVVVKVSLLESDRKMVVRSLVNRYRCVLALF